MKTATVLLLALVLSIQYSPAQPNQKKITVYTDEFAGAKEELGPGQYDNMHMIRAGIVTIKSVKVPKGMKVTLYSHDQFQGVTLDLTEDANTQFLESKGFAQTILSVSLIVEELPSEAALTGPAVTIYRDDFAGGSLLLAPGSYEPADLGNVGNDALSSIKIPSGLKVTLYEHGGFKGRSLVLRKDTRASYLVGNKFNDITSSLLVEVEPVAPVAATAAVAVIAAPTDTQPVTVAAPVVINEPAEPIIYAGDFSGASKQVRAGRYSVEELGIGNDQLSSIKVPAGFRVTLYENDAFEGRSLVLTRDTRAAYLADNNFNNATSSIFVENLLNVRVAPTATLYSNDLEGMSTTLTAGRYTSAQLGIGDNTLSSIKVPRGLEVTIFENENFTGRAMTVRSDTRTNFIDANQFNDIASSVEVKEVFAGDLSATIYADRFGGFTQTLLPGKYLLKDLAGGDNQVSSACVPPGMRVVMYEDDNFQGYSVTAERDIDLTQAFNDRVSSVYVEDIFTPLVSPIVAKPAGSASGRRPGGGLGGAAAIGAVATPPNPAPVASATPEAQPPPCAMNSSQYQNALNSIKSKSWDTDKMDMAKISTKDRCLNVMQVREIGRLFDSEDQSLEFVKSAYDRSSEKTEYYLLQDLFKYPSTQQAFTQFLQSK